MFISLGVLRERNSFISVSEKFGTEKLYRFVRRIRRNHYDNIWEERKKNYLDWRHIVQIIEHSDSEDDVLNFETLPRQSEFKKISQKKMKNM